MIATILGAANTQSGVGVASIRASVFAVALAPDQLARVVDRHHQRDDREGCPGAPGSAPGSRGRCCRRRPLSVTVNHSPAPPLNSPSASSTKKAGLRNTWPMSSRVRARSWAATAFALPLEGGAAASGLCPSRQARARRGPASCAIDEGLIPKGSAPTTIVGAEEPLPRGVSKHAPHRPPPSRRAAAASRFFAFARRRLEAEQGVGGGQSGCKADAAPDQPGSTAARRPAARAGRCARVAVQ